MLRNFFAGLLALALMVMVNQDATAQRLRQPGTASATGNQRQVRTRPVVPKIGSEIADFELKNAKGKKVKLSQFRDKKFVILELGACT